MKKLVTAYTLLFALAVFALWRYCFYGDMWHAEGVSFFSAFEDCRTLQFTLPQQWDEYIGAFLLQFFRYSFYGALTQSLLAVSVLLAGISASYSIFRNPRLLWLAFIPAACFLAVQFGDLTLKMPVRWVVASWLIALILRLLFRRRHVALRLTILNHRATVALMPLLLTACSVYFKVLTKPNMALEKEHRLALMTERKDWDGVLQYVSSDETARSASVLRAVTLALSEKELLTERLFAYEIPVTECFICQRRNTMECNFFNARFFRALKLYNETIHYSFQASQQTPHGMCFSSLRTITDALLEKNDLRTAAKYVEILKHTTMNGAWARSRERYIATQAPTFSADSITSSPRAFFIGAHPFSSDMARLAERYPDNRKVADLLLMSLLVQRELDKFYAIFKRVSHLYPSVLPRYYEEALLLLYSQQPEAVSGIAVSKQAAERFSQFMLLFNGGENNRAALRRQFGDSFWHYCLCRNETRYSIEL